MPIYEYRCQDCGHDFEQLHRSMSKAKHARCPQCQSDNVQRQWSVFATRQETSESAGCPIGGCDPASPPPRNCPCPGACGLE